MIVIMNSLLPVHPSWSGLDITPLFFFHLPLRPVARDLAVVLGHVARPTNGLQPQRAQSNGGFGVDLGVDLGVGVDLGAGLGVGVDLGVDLRVGVSQPHPCPPNDHHPMMNVSHHEGVTGDIYWTGGYYIPI